MWHVIEAKYPEILRGSENRYQNWETVDPEKWVPDGYAGSASAARSPCTRTWTSRPTCCCRSSRLRKRARG
jgi:hypothetical protein